MNFRIFLLAIVLPAHFSFAQTEPLKFGEVSLAELKMASYEKDTSAAAVVLFNRGIVTLDPNSTTGTSFVKHTRIKIFNKSASDDWANIKLLVEKNGLRKFKAATYNLVDGRIEKTEISANQLFEKKHDKYSEEISFAFPNVREGSVLEFEYTTIYELSYLPTWQFQYSIPVVRSEFTLVGPSKLTQHLSGSIQLTNHNVKHNGARREWLMTHIPAFKAEPLMPNEEAYLSYLRIGSTKTWEQIYIDLMRNISLGQIVVHHYHLSGKVKEITAGIADPLEKIKAISDYVKKVVAWNGICDYLAYDPKEVLEKKSGSAGDINLLFGSMLKKAGFNVGLVLLSTRDHGFVLREFPSSSQFDYVICHVVVNGKELLLDATEKMLPYDMLPLRCFNHNGFLISLEQHGWLGIEPPKRSKISLTANLTLDANGVITGHVNSSKEGYAAFNARKELDINPDDYKRNSFVNRLWSVQKFEILNGQDIDKPLIENYELVMNDNITVANDLIYINPFFFLSEEVNPFLEDERIYPIDFDSTVDKVSVCNISIPDGYTVEEFPQSKVFSLPDNAAKCTFNLSANGNRIVVMSRLQINKTWFMQAEYGNLREFYSRIVAKYSENIVLRKKT